MLQKIVFCLLGFFILIFVSSCGVTGTSGVASQRSSLAHAEELVRAMIYEKVPDMNPSAQFPLEEITIDEIWKRLGIQVYTVIGDSIYHDYTYLIKDQKVEFLGGGFSRHSITSMQVVELNGNHEAEFVYAFSGGSGLHYSQLAWYCSDCPEKRIITSNLVYLYGDLILDKINECKVMVKAGYFDLQDRFITEATLGELTLTQGPSEKQLEVLLNNDLPQRVRERIKVVEP